MKISINFLDKKYKVKSKLDLYEIADDFGESKYGLAIVLEKKNHHKKECFESVITKFFGEFIVHKNAAHIDLNNCPYATKLLASGYATDTGLYKEDGFCKYPLWQFTEEFLKKCGRKNYKKYSKAHKKYMEANL